MGAAIGWRYLISSSAGFRDPLTKFSAKAQGAVPTSIKTELLTANYSALLHFSFALRDTMSSH